MTTIFKGGLAASTLALLMALPAASFAQDLTVKIGGRAMLDYTIGEIGDQNIDATEARRVRLNATGTYGSAIKYKVELNTDSSGDVNVEDAYLEFKPEGAGLKVKVGQFRTYNSLDEQTSSRFSSAIERAAFTDAFGFDRRVGVSVSTAGDNYTLDVGAYTTNLEEDGGPDEGHALAIRGTFNPIKTDETITHLGASWRYRSKGGSAPDLRYRQRPFTHAAPSRIIDTGRFADSDNFYGVEAAVLHKNFWAAGEYGMLAADGSGANEDADFSGFYAEVGMTLGGKKVYKGGKFNRSKVDNPVGEGGYGAVALVARYDSVDLQDEVYTGKLNTIILGADWMPTEHTRIRLNYFNADAENGSADKGEGVVARLGFDF